MNEQADRQDNWRSRWRRGELAGQPAVATVVLAFVLVAGLLGAQVVVLARSGVLRARTGGAELIAQVAAEGLEAFLGRRPIIRYHLLENEGEVIGFSAMHIGPRLQENDELIYEGKEILYLPGVGKQLDNSFSIANDLTHYSYVEWSRDLTTGGSEFSVQQFEAGQLTVLDSYRRTQRMSLANVLETNNLVCPALLDFFSSLVGERSGRKGAVFTAPFVVSRGTGRSLVRLVEFLVERGAEVPQAVRTAYPEGRAVEVKWLQLARTQSIYYDQEHQLVWQKDPAGTIDITRAVSRSELIRAFPDEDQMLDRWLREGRDADNDSELF